MSVFPDAANLIKRKGLAHRTNRGPKGEVCVLQAIDDSLPKGRNGQSIGFYDAYERLREALNGEDPQQWNDRVSDVSRIKKDTDKKAAFKAAQNHIVGFLRNLR